MCFLSNALCSNCTTSCPIVFFAEKPLVHVSSTPESNAFCSTGKENVRPKCRAGGSTSIEVVDNAGEVRDDGIPEGSPVGAVVLEESVRNASTESAR
jgi:hypothetical protein